MSTVIDSIERSQMRQGLPDFDAGDRVRVHFQVVEGNRRRTQVFEGIVIKRQGSGVRETFTVRKQSFGVGVERTFPLHSPKIEQLEVAARGRVRRAKLYYLKGRIGKAARVAERRWGIHEDLIGTSTALDAEGVAQDEPDEDEPDAPESDEAAAEEPVAEEPVAEGSSGQPEAEAEGEGERAGEADEGEAAGDEAAEGAGDAPEASGETAAEETEKGQD